MNTPGDQLQQPRGTNEPYTTFQAGTQSQVIDQRPERQMLVYRDATDDRGTRTASYSNSSHSWTPTSPYSIDNRTPLQETSNVVAPRPTKRKRTLHDIAIEHATRAAAPATLPQDDRAGQRHVPTSYTRQWMAASGTLPPSYSTAVPIQRPLTRTPSAPPLFYARSEALANSILHSQPSAQDRIPPPSRPRGRTVAKPQEAPVPRAEQQASEGNTSRISISSCEWRSSGQLPGMPGYGLDSDGQPLGRRLLGEDHFHNRVPFEACIRERALNLMRQSGWYTLEEIRRASIRKSTTVLQVMARNRRREERAYKQATSNREFDFGSPEPEPKHMCRGKA